MTVIDSLVVMLGLDSTDLENKSPRAVKSLDSVEKAGDKTEKSVAKISKTSKDTAHSVEGLTRVVSSFLAIIGGTVAIKAFIEDFIDTNAQLDRLSKNLGLSVSTISAWGNAVEGLGGSAQGLQGTLDMLSKSQTQVMLTGESSLIPYMSALGISLADVNGKARPVTDILLELSDHFSKMDRTTANNMGRMMGLDQGTLNLLLKGRKELELEIARQKQQNAVTKEQAAEASKLQTSIVGLKQQFGAFGRSLLMDAAPAIEKILSALGKFGDWIAEHKSAVEAFLTVLTVGLTAISAIALANPFTLAAAAIALLAGAIALLYDDYQTWKKGGDSLIDWGKWEPGITAATKALKLLGIEIEADFALITKLFDLWDKLPNWVKGALTIGTNIPGATVGIPKLAGGDGDSRFQNIPSINKDNSLADAISRQEGFGVKGSRAQRNNNPGNIEYGKFAAEHGATGSDGRFAIFPDAASGRAALDALLRSKAYAGLSVPDAIRKYAPSNENDTNGYIASVQKMMGGIPGAASFASNAPQAAGSAGTTGSVDKSVSVTIHKIDVNAPNATDADGIASGLYDSLDYLFVSQANPGLT